MSSSDASATSLPGRIVSATCVVLLAVHLALRFHYQTMKDGLDAVALGLAVVALSPWIATIFKSLKFGGMEIQFQEVKDKVAAQAHEIDQLTFLIRNFLPRWELEHMNNLSLSQPFMVDFRTASPEFEGELRRLRAHKFIEHCSGMKLGELFRDRQRRNLHDHFRLTDLGRDYLRHREDIDRRAAR